MRVQDEEVFAVAEAQDLDTVLVFTTEMAAEVDPAHLGAEGQQLAAGHPDGLPFIRKEKAALGVTLVTLKVFGFVE